MAWLAPSAHHNGGLHVECRLPMPTRPLPCACQAWVSVETGRVWESYVWGLRMPLPQCVGPSVLGGLRGAPSVRGEERLPAVCAPGAGLSLGQLFIPQMFCLQ